MGHAELLRKIEALRPAQRIAIEQLVDSLVPDDSRRGIEVLEEALKKARGSWPVGMTAEQIDAEVSTMRSEWDQRGWEGGR
jgi:hypothetical protein